MTRKRTSTQTATPAPVSPVAPPEILEVPAIDLKLVIETAYKTASKARKIGKENAKSKENIRSLYAIHKDAMDAIVQGLTVEIQKWFKSIVKIRETDTDARIVKFANENITKIVALLTAKGWTVTPPAAS